MIAEEVAKVNLALKNPYSVRYQQINAMFLNEFLKEHRKVEKLEVTVADLAAEWREIRAQVQMNPPAMRVAGENR